MRAIFRLGLAIIALLLAGVVADTVRAAPRGGVRSSLAAVETSRGTGGAIRSAIVLQRSDCEGNLRMLDLLHRPDVRERLRLAVIWYVGPTGDSAVIRALLPSWTQHVPLQEAPVAALRELAQLGHRGTPLLVVLDQEGRVRLTTQSPRSAREFAGLRAIVEGLTWVEEL